MMMNRATLGRPVALLAATTSALVTMCLGLSMAKADPAPSLPAPNAPEVERRADLGSASPREVPEDAEPIEAEENASATDPSDATPPPVDPRTVDEASALAVAAESASDESPDVATNAGSATSPPVGSTGSVDEASAQKEPDGSMPSESSPVPTSAASSGAPTSGAPVTESAPAASSAREASVRISTTASDDERALGMGVADWRFGGSSHGVFQEVDVGYDFGFGLGLVGQFQHTIVFQRVGGLGTRVSANEIATRVGLRFRFDIAPVSLGAQATVGGGLSFLRDDFSGRTFGFDTLASGSGLLLVDLEVVRWESVAVTVGASGGIDVQNSERDDFQVYPRGAVGVGVRW